MSKMTGYRAPLLTVTVTRTAAVCVFLASVLGAALTAHATEPYEALVNDFKAALNTQDTTHIASFFQFPIAKRYPVPDIANQEDFVERFEHVLSTEVIDQILNSSTTDDWRVIGTRGIALHQGMLWMNWEGRVTAIGYETAVASSYERRLIDEMAQAMHASLAGIKQPIGQFETDQSTVRIDITEHEEYRLAVWSNDKTLDQLPDLVAHGGDYELLGNEGNIRYAFPTGDVVYEVLINAVGDCANIPPPALFMIVDDGEVIDQQAAVHIEGFGGFRDFFIDRWYECQSGFGIDPVLSTW
jgi:hypothetical protein